MQVKDIIDLVSDELRDGANTKYSRPSILLKLKESATQFATDSSMLKYTVEILPVAGQSVYSLPLYGVGFQDWTGICSNTSGSVYDTAPTSSTVTPTYLKAVRIGWKSLDGSTPRTAQGGSPTSGTNFLATSTNKVLHAASTFSRDEAGLNYVSTGEPQYLYNDELNFYEFGVWPAPSATAIDAADVADNIASGGDSAIDADNRFQVQYVRDVLYYDNAAGTGTPVDPSNLSETDYIEPAIPLQFQRKLYLLICYLRLKNSVDPNDVIKSEKYRELYEQDLLAPALQAGAHMERYNQLSVAT